jgi:rhodanese-related sulfurtransferase
MLKNLLYLVLALSLFMAIGCDEDNPEEPDPINEFALVTEIGDLYVSSYTTAGGLGVNTTIGTIFPVLTDGNASNDPYMIDWRSASDYATGHIKGAVNMSLGTLVDKIDDGTIPKDKTILNICYTGQTASYATSILNLLGYEAQNLKFGMCGVTTDSTINGTSKWVGQIASDEFATQLTATVTTTSTDYEFPVLTTGKETAEEIIKERAKVGTASWGKISAADVFANPGNYFIINYWPQGEYEIPGHIPGAFCFPPKASLGSDQLLNKLPTDKTIVIYCYTGQTSAQMTAYLQVLGYDAKSLLYGVNGFAYDSMTKSKYSAPSTDYSAIIEK